MHITKPALAAPSTAGAREWRRLALWTGLIAASGWLGLALRPEGLGYPVLALSLGLGFGALLRYGLRLWPALFLAHVLIVPPLGGDWADALAAGVVETVGAVAGWLVLKRSGHGQEPLASMAGLLAFLGATAVLVLTTVVLRGAWWWLQDGAAQFSSRLAYGSLASALGALLAAPPVLCWGRSGAPLDWRAWGGAGLLVLALAGATLAGTLAWSGTAWDYVWYLWLPVLAWAAWRGGQLGAALMSLICTFVIALGSRYGLGPFVEDGALATVLHWQSFAVSFAATALLLATAAREQGTAEARLREHQEQLAQQISVRTGALERALRERERVEADLRATVVARQEARERLDQSERRYHQLIDTLNDGFVMLNEAGAIDFGNRRLAELTGWTLANLAGRPLGALFGQRERCKLAHQLALAREHSVTAFELALRRRGGECIPVLVSPAVLSHDGRFLGWSVLLYDLRERKAEETARQELLRVHRDALVREVHHRIKNNLQGIVGLLRQHLRRAPEQAPVLENAIAQVNSVAMVYGLQAREKGQGVRLRGLVESVREAIMRLTGARILLAHDEPEYDAALSGQEGVPIALVLNELMTNSVKHGLSAAGSQLVSLSLDWHDEEVIVSIRNPARPGAYPPPPGTGGAGLSLVRALLPSHGAGLTIEAESEGYVRASLRLTAPVVFLEREPLETTTTRRSS